MKCDFARQSHLLDERSKRIRDYRVFDFNYIPDEPLMRDEVKPLVDACLRYLKTGIANHLFIFGSRGCGKTVMIKYIQRLLTARSNVDVVYVNCRQHNTQLQGSGSSARRPSQGLQPRRTLAALLRRPSAAFDTDLG